MTIGKLIVRYRGLVKSSPTLVALLRLLNLGKMRMFHRKSLWRSGLRDELSFWRYLFESDFGRIEPYLRLDREIPDYLGTAIDRCGFRRVRLLDVGSGPLILGTRWKDATIDLTAVDPLADEYVALMRSSGLAVDFRIVNARAEDLVATFGRESFDIVHAANAIDHSETPLACLGQMLDVTRPGGATVCQHLRNEGHSNAYHGLHQWNFDIVDEAPVIWTPFKREYPLEHLTDGVRFEGAALPRVVRWNFFKEAVQ